MNLTWKENIQIERNREQLYNQFKEKAEALTCRVERFSSKAEAEAFISEFIKEFEIKKTAPVELSLVDLQKIKDSLPSSTEVMQIPNMEDVENAELGITEFELGIAELGSLVQDANGIYKRLASSLPPTHMALLSTDSIVESFDEALEVIESTYGKEMPEFISFISGPSKTADIERVLTIGVHGPGKLIIICIDEEKEQ